MTSGLRRTPWNIGRYCTDFIVATPVHAVNETGLAMLQLSHVVDRFGVRTTRKKATSSLVAFDDLRFHKRTDWRLQILAVTSASKSNHAEQAETDQGQRTWFRDNLLVAEDNVIVAVR